MKNNGEINSLDEIIVSNLLEAGGALDAETIWLNMKAQGISISIGSVYLKIKKLVDTGVIKRVQNGQRKSVYCCGNDEITGDQTILNK